MYFFVGGFSRQWIVTLVLASRCVVWTIHNERKLFLLGELIVTSCLRMACTNVRILVHVSCWSTFGDFYPMLDIFHSLTIWKVTRYFCTTSPKLCCFMFQILYILTIHIRGWLRNKYHMCWMWYNRATKLNDQNKRNEKISMMPTALIYDVKLINDLRI